ncbi:hypothetical protein Taro_037629 [Colocasia esculenta]|uniref:Uncharacterized protein n=1 Tax=Colocasia esculenta TaxID=4460 RepID=A0A843WLB1_COLES|nr:hypothetical protein [Colocasia esculenta]
MAGSGARKVLIVLSATVWMVALLLLMLLTSPPAVEARVLIEGRRRGLASSFADTLLELLPKGSGGSSGSSGCTLGSFNNGRPCQLHRPENSAAESAGYSAESLTKSLLKTFPDCVKDAINLLNVGEHEKRRRLGEWASLSNYNRCLSNKQIQEVAQKLGLGELFWNSDLPRTKEGFYQFRGLVAAAMGMLVYVERIQREERRNGVDTLAHQNWSGANFYDQYLKIEADRPNRTCGRDRRTIHASVLSETSSPELRWLVTIDSRHMACPGAGKVLALAAILWMFVLLISSPSAVEATVAVGGRRGLASSYVDTFLEALPKGTGGSSGSSGCTASSVLGRPSPASSETLALLGPRAVFVVIEHQVRLPPTGNLLEIYSQGRPSNLFVIATVTTAFVRHRRSSPSFSRCRLDRLRPSKGKSLHTFGAVCGKDAAMARRRSSYQNIGSKATRSRQSCAESRLRSSPVDVNIAPAGANNDVPTPAAVMPATALEMAELRGQMQQFTGICLAL